MIVSRHHLADSPVLGRELHAAALAELADGRAVELLPRRLVDELGRRVRRPPPRELGVVGDEVERAGVDVEDDAVATAAPPWSRARLGEFDATVLRAAGWLSVRLGWGFGGERAPGTTWSRDDGRGCACACDVSQRPWCALGRDCLVWSSVAYLASAGRTFDAWAALEDAPPNFIVVGHIDRVAAAFSKVVVVPALAEQSGEAPAAWPAPPNSCAPEGPTSVPMMFRPLRTARVLERPVGRFTAKSGFAPMPMPTSFS